MRRVTLLQVRPANNSDAVHQYRLIQIILGTAPRCIYLSHRPCSACHYDDNDRWRYPPRQDAKQKQFHTAHSFPLWSHSRLLCARALEFRNCAISSKLWRQSSIPGTRCRFKKNLQSAPQKNVTQPRYRNPRHPSFVAVCAQKPQVRQ